MQLGRPLDIAVENIDRSLDGAFWPELWSRGSMLCYCEPLLNWRVLPKLIVVRLLANL